MNHRILVADDDLTTRKLLEFTLLKMGFEVTAVSNGVEADLVLQGENPPHLAILDWSMPGLSGLDVCRGLRKRSDGIYVYVILLTARQGSEEFNEAFSAGVDDFLSKPVNIAWLKHRLAVGVRVVESALALVAKQAELAGVILNLEAMAEKRAKEMVHTDRLATLGTLAAGVAHEINNPATFISGNIRILKDCWPVVETALVRYGEGPDADRSQVEFIRTEAPKILEGALVGVGRIQTIVDGLKHYAHKGNEQVEPFDIGPCVRNALAICHSLLKYTISVKTDLPDHPVRVMGHPQQMEQVFINLITNAVDAMQEQESGSLSLSVLLEDDRVLVQVDDSGPGFDSGALDHIWKPFFTTKVVGKGTGLGLSIVQRIVRNHEGWIEAVNRPGGGASFQIRLPLLIDLPATAVLSGTAHMGKLEGQLVFS